MEKHHYFSIGGLWGGQHILNTYIYTYRGALYFLRLITPQQLPETHTHTLANTGVKLMAEIFIPKIIDLLADITLKKINERVDLVVGAEEEVKKLSKSLETLERKLYNAGSRRLEDDDVRAWLEMLDDVAYEMEDVLEEWNIKIVKIKEDHEPPVQKPHTLLEKVRMFIQSLSSCLKQVPLRSEFGPRIKEINDKLDSILTEAQKFSFIPTTPPKNAFSEFKQPITWSNVDETKVLGRENDKNILFQHLLPESLTIPDQKLVQDERFKVISIVGLGGSGKTTLAQILYNDERVRNHFDLKKWVCVSDPFDGLRIAKSLVESPGNDMSNLGIGSLLERAKDLFSDKRFLLVLDDVWIEDSSKWEQIMLSLKDCAPGSILLVTTRSEWVARAMGTHHQAMGTPYQHKLGFLEDSDIWLIIKQIALSKRSEPRSIFENIGLRIAKKCKGFPLAAKTLGGVLLFKDSLREWQEILDSNIWKMEKQAVKLFPHFYLSYKELSPEDKRCFSFCAIFPKDHMIDTGRLIKMWMAQGYLGGGERMEMEGGDVVKNLAVRSFFQEIEEDCGVIYRVKMHDLVHDFAQFLVKGECQAFVEGEAHSESVDSEGRRPRRHVMAFGQEESILDFLDFDIGNLRTLSLGDSGFFDAVPVPCEFVRSLCSRLKSVRTFSLPGLKLEELPREIGNLIHLRFLNVSWNPFKELPETIGDLHCLQALDVTGCGSLKHLPKRLGDLRQMRHLLNRNTAALEPAQPGIENLTSLRVVTNMVLRADGASFDVFAKMRHLEELGVSFAEWGDSVDAAVLKLVQHVSHVQDLTIQEYEAPMFPKEIVSEFANSSITRLCIMSCSNISSLPALGKLPSLQHLALDYLEGLKHIGRELYGLSEADVHTKEQCKDVIVAFPVLKTLRMAWNLETWEDICEEDNNVSVMPLLEELEIFNCPLLVALPRQIIEKASHLKTLNIIGCYKLKIEKSWMRTIRTCE